MHDSRGNEVRLAVGQLASLVTLLAMLVGAVVYQTTMTVANSTKIEAHEKRIDNLEGTVFVRSEQRSR